jgi:hypothetical protein
MKGVEMKLIDEKEVEVMFSGSKNRAAFIAGITFAEQKILPLMVEFVKWTSCNYTAMDGVFIPIGCTDVIDWLDSEQLLKQFLKTKEK